jgi:uncharacterized protein (TIRG00374 family)
LSLNRLLRLLVAVALTTYVLWRADVGVVVRAAAGADLQWIAAAVGLVLVDRTLMAMRWIDLLTALTPGSRPRFGVVLRIFFVSSFVSNFVPSVAADMYRAYALARHEVRLSESTASVLMDRVLGVLSMVLVGVLSLLVVERIGPRRALAASLALALIACAAVAAIVFSERAARFALGIGLKLPWTRTQRILTSLTDAVRRYAHHHAELARVLLMSIAVQAIRVVQAWCLGRAIGIELPLSTYFVLVPIILVIMQLPITINGFGTTQVAFERLFVPAGAASAPVAALSLLFLALGMVGTLPGGVLYALSPPPVVPSRSDA